MKLEYMQQNHFMSGGLYHKIIAWEWAVPRKCCINGRMLRKIVAKVGTLPKNQIKNLINSHGVERSIVYNIPRAYHRAQKSITAGSLEYRIVV